MGEEKSYNEIRSLIDAQASKIMKPLEIDRTVAAAVRQHDINPAVINKLLFRLNQTRTNKLKRIYNKQAIHLISVQTLNALKQDSIARLKTLLNLNLLLIPFRISDLSKDNHNKHEFSIFEKENELSALIDGLPDYEDLLAELGEDGKEDLDEILQKYDLLISELQANIRRYHVFINRLQKYEEFLKTIEQNLDPAAVQKNLVISSNTTIIEQMNRSRILIEKVNQKLS